MHSRASQFSGKRKIKLLILHHAEQKKLLFECCAFQIVTLMLGGYNYIHEASLYCVSLVCYFLTAFSFWNQTYLSFLDT